MVKTAWFLLILLLFFVPQGFASWVTNTVDTNESLFMGIDMDSQGRAHISYLDNTNDTLNHAFYNGSGWENETVSTIAHAYSSIVMDSNDYTRIVAQTGSGVINYFSYNGTSWTSETIASNVGYLSYSSLALTPDGNPGVSYYNDVDGYTQYASYNGTSWDIETIDTFSYSIQTSLVIDSGGYAHMIYTDNAAYVLHYAAFNGTNWNIEDVSDDKDGGAFKGSLVLDGSGNPHVSYYGSDSLIHSQYNGSGWDRAVVDALSGVVNVYDTSIVIDSNGNIYISYSVELLANDELRLATFNGTGWSIEVLYQGVLTDAGPSDRGLSLYNDYLYLAFSGDGQLLSMTNAPQGFVDEPSLNILALIIFILIIVHCPQSMVYEKRY